jgi:hypothetical protein
MTSDDPGRAEGSAGGRLSEPARVEALSDACSPRGRAGGVGFGREPRHAPHRKQARPAANHGNLDTLTAGSAVQLGTPSLTRDSLIRTRSSSVYREAEGVPEMDTAAACFGGGMA